MGLKERAINNWFTGICTVHALNPKLERKLLQVSVNIGLHYYNIIIIIIIIIIIRYY